MINIPNQTAAVKPTFRGVTAVAIGDICEVRGKGGMGNTAEIINRLVRLGVLKKVRVGWGIRRRLLIGWCG